MSAPSSPPSIASPLSDDEHVVEDQVDDQIDPDDDPEVVVASVSSMNINGANETNGSNNQSEPSVSPKSPPAQSPSSTASNGVTKKQMDLSSFGSPPVAVASQSKQSKQPSSLFSFGKKTSSSPASTPKSATTTESKRPSLVANTSTPLPTSSSPPPTATSRFSLGSIFKSFSDRASNSQSNTQSSAAIREQQHEAHKKEWNLILTSGASYSDPKIRARCIKLAWHGIPSSIRGDAWKFIIGNQLNITEDLFWIMMGRAQEVKELKMMKEKQRQAELDADPDSISSSTPTANKEESVALIDTDVSRTFQELKFFHGGGPLQGPLFQILEAYGCYRPDVGYVQGMSYLAAMMLLNLDTLDAFIALCNLLNQDMYFKFFRMNASQMAVHLRAFQVIFSEQLPALHAHFETTGILPDMYLYEWLLTIFSRSLALDATHRIWDNFLCQGHVFLFRTALGLLRMQQQAFMAASFEECLDMLHHPPKDFDVDSFFNDHVAKINVQEDKLNKIIAQEQLNA